MVSSNLKNAYNNLDLNGKRNKHSDELLLIEELLKVVENRFGLIPNFKIKNYEQRKFTRKACF